MSEQNASFVNWLRNKIQKFKPGIAGEPKKKSSEMLPDTPSMAGFFRSLAQSYLEALFYAASRLDKYDKYKFLDENLAEASASLNIYADNIVSGAIGGEENYMVCIDSNAGNVEELEKIVLKTEQRTGIKDHIWEISRDMTKYGDDFEEIVVNKDGEDIYISKLKKLPVKTIFANVDNRGVFIDPDFPYIQKMGKYEKKGIPFDWWRIVHFKIGRDIYGVDRSIFANASQRIGRQLLWVDDSLVLARISRAWQRYAYLVDTKGLSPDAAWEFLQRFEERVRRREVVDPTTGRISLEENPLLPDEDIFLPVSEDSKTDIKLLTGDANIGNIEDIKYFQTKFLMAMSVPKAYVSIEEGTRAKATLSQIDIQFARQVRRRQAALIPGLKQFYKTAFYLAGIDPNSFKWTIKFPELATTDELLKWEMEKLKAEVSKLLVVDVGVVNTEYIAREFLGFDDDEIQKYTPFGKEEFGLERFQLPPETAAMIRKDPYVRHILDDLKDLIAWKKAREEELEGMLEVGISRKTPLSSRRQ